MNKNPNLAQIAEAAGVSMSTVDRVMNGRGSVSLARRRKVIEAARALGAYRQPASSNAFSLHINVVRTAADDEYFARLERALSSAAGVTAPRVVLHFLRETPQTAADWAAVMQASSRRRHGVILLAHDRLDGTEALGRLSEPSMPVVALSSDMASVAPRFYIGIDNVAAGRTAALMIAGLAPREGRVLLLTGPQSFQVHRDRSGGFREALRQHGPRLELVGPLDTGDRADEAQRLCRSALHGDKPVVAIYNTGGANAGIAEALRANPQHTGAIWIAHEATPGNLALLQEGVIRLIVDQDPDAQAVAALQYLLYANGETGTPPDASIRFHIVTAENLPPP